MPIVELPNGSEVEFPEGMSADDMASAIRNSFPDMAGAPPKSSGLMDVINEATDWALGKKLDGEKGGSVLQDKVLPDPQLDPELNRQTMLKSGSPDSVMFNAGRGKARADAMVNQGAARERAALEAQRKLKADADAEDYGAGTFAKDMGAKLMSGGAGVAESVVGLYDLTTGGAAGRVLEDMGYDPQSTKAFWSGFYSDTQKQQDAEVNNADGFVNTLEALAVNPAALIGSVAESLPGTIVAGAGAGKFVKFIAGRAATEAVALGLSGEAATKFISDQVKKQAFQVATVAGLSEGAQSAGSIAEAGRQYGKDWSDYILPAIVNGLGTAATSMVSGKIAAKFGIGDIETDIAARSAGVKGVGVGKFGAIKNTFLEAGKEGTFEEMPQSILDQGAQNIVTDRPLTEGMGNAAARGLTTGAGMAGAHSAIRSSVAGLQDKLADNSPEAQIARAIQDNVDRTTFAGINAQAVQALSANGAGAVQLQSQAHISTASTPNEAVAAFNDATQPNLPTGVRTAPTAPIGTISQPVDVATSDSLLQRAEQDIAQQEAQNGTTLAASVTDNSLPSAATPATGTVGDGLGAMVSPTAGATGAPQADVGTAAELPGTPSAPSLTTAPSDQGAASSYANSGVFETQQAAELYVKANQLEGKVELHDTGRGIAVSPVPQKETVGELKQQEVAVSNLVAARGTAAGNLRRFDVRELSSLPDAEAVGVGRTAAVVSAINPIVKNAFGFNIIPTMGLENYGVAYQGNIFVDVETVAKSEKLGRGDASALAIAAIGHEATHAQLQRSADPQVQQDYQAFTQVARSYMRRGMVEKRQQLEDAAFVAEGQAPRGKQYAENEVMADIHGAMWTDPKFWAELYRVDNGSTMRRVAYRFMQAATRFIEVAKGSRMDAGRFVTNVDAVRKAAAQVWASQAGSKARMLSISQASSELFDAKPEYSRGVIAEVAPNPDGEIGAQWRAMQAHEKEQATRSVANKTVQRVFDLLNLKGWSFKLSNGTYQGERNPNLLIEAPENATQEQLDQVANALGYVYDQKAMVSYDEDTRTGDDLASFIKIAPPATMSTQKVNELREWIAQQVTQVSADTLMDGQIVIGNFSAYDDAVETLDDGQFREAIIQAVTSFAYDGQIGVSQVERYQSKLIQPDSREGYLKGFDDGNSTVVQARPGDTRSILREDGQGGYVAGLTRLGDEAVSLRQQWIDSSTSGRERANRNRKLAAEKSARSDSAGAVEYGKPTPGSVAAVGVHFSKEKRSVLVSTMYGTGLKGLESVRLAGQADIGKRLYFYVDSGSGIHPEAGVGSAKHVVKLNNLYDANADHLGILKNAKGDNAYDRFNIWERNIMRSGFDGYLADTGGHQKFVVLLGDHSIALSRAAQSIDEISDLGNFDLDFTHGDDTVASDDLSDEAIRAKLQAELAESQALSRRNAAQATSAVPPAARPATLEDMKAQGLHPEQALDAEFGEAIERDTLDAVRLVFSGPAFQSGGWASRFGNPSVTIKKSDSAWMVHAPGTWSIKPMDQMTAIKFAKNMAAAEHIAKADFDLAGVYRKNTIKKLVGMWQKLSAKPGLFTLPDSGTSLTFKEIAAELKAMPQYDIRVEDSYGGFTIFFTRKHDRQRFHADININTSSISCCTMGLFGSGDLGTQFYAVAAEYARLNNKKFFADATLSSINTARRTEQALSYALKTGRTDVLLPGVQNRVYGFNKDPQTPEDHLMNTGRLLLANMRNVTEVDPNIRRLDYNPDTDTFTDSRGQDASAKVQTFLNLPMARAFGMGRTTVARAVLTSQIVGNRIEPDAVTKFLKPIAYSRDFGFDEPISEEWGEPGAVAPNVKKFLGRSVMVHEDGTPIPMYHGTAQDINAFKAKQAGAIFVTHSPKFADDFAWMSQDWMAAHYAELLSPEQIQAAKDAATKDVMANTMRKLSDRKRLAAEIEYGRVTGEAKDILMERIKDQMPSGPHIIPLIVRAEHPFDYEQMNHRIELSTMLFQNAKDSGTLVRVGGDDAIAIAAMEKPLTEMDVQDSLLSGEWDFIESDEVQQVIHDLGYDSFWVKESGQRNLAVYHPNQLKSAIGNNGNYDRADDRIAYSRSVLDDYLNRRNQSLPLVSPQSVLNADIELATKAFDAAIGEISNGSNAMLSVPVGRLPHVFGLLRAQSQMLKIDTSIVRKVFIGKHANEMGHLNPHDLIRAIYNPAMVLKGHQAGEYELVTSIVTPVGPVIVPIVTNAKSPDGKTTYAAVMSMYGKKVTGGKLSLMEKIRSGGLLYADPAQAQAALTGRGAVPPVGINSGRTQTYAPPPTEGQKASVLDKTESVKPLNINFVGWAQVRGFITEGIALKKVKSDVDLMKWIGDNYKSTSSKQGWDDAPAFSRTMDQTDTPEFKRWFGNSKAVDADGKPLVVYHGTTKSFDTFSNGTGWFTSDPGEANFWGGLNSKGSNVVPAYLSIKNPRVLQASEASRNKIIDALEALRRDEDGVIVMEDGKIRWAVVAEPTQIKSATGNNGAFDPANPDIRYSRPTVGDNFTLPSETRTSQARRILQDYLLPVLNAQKALLKQGGLVGEAQDVNRAEERMHGRTEEAIKDFASKVFMPLVEKAAKADIEMDELSLYAYAMHAPERNAHIASIDRKLQDGGSGMTDQESADIIAAFDAEGKLDALQDLHNDLMAITATTRRTLLEEDLITQEQYDSLEQQYQYYIPLRGFAELNDEDMPSVVRRGGRGFNIRGQETMRALGRVSRASDLIENVVSDYEKAIVRGERNAVGKVFLDLVLSNPDEKLWQIDATETRKSFNKATGRVARTTKIDTGPDTLAVKVRGREVYIKVYDPLILRAMKLAYKDDTGALAAFLNDTIGLYSTLMRNTLTRFNPVFAAVNAVRDFGMGSVSVVDKLGFKGQAKYAKHYAGATRASWRNERGTQQQDEWGKWFEEFRAAGGTTGGYYARGVDEIHGDIRDAMLLHGASPKNFAEKMKSGKPYAALKKLGHALEVIGSTSENAARVAAYRTAREMGKSPAEAASIAKNLTTNFNRKGEWGQVLNTLFVFYNAAIQGSARTLEALSNRKVQGVMAMSAAAGFAMAMLNAANGGDDDDGQAYWDKIPDYEKERNFIIMFPPGTSVTGLGTIGKHGRYIKIPMPYGFNVFPMLGQQLADVYRHSQDDMRGLSPGRAIMNMANAVMGSFNPFGGAIDFGDPNSVGMALAPSLADVVWQQANGVNAFNRKTAPYKSEFDTRLDSENVTPRQAGGAAHMLARALNKATGGNAVESGAIDVAPGSIENVWRNMSGGTGTFLSDVLVNLPTKMVTPESEITPRDLVLLRNFYGVVDENNDATLFYERRQKVNEAAAVQNRYDANDIERAPDAEFDALVSLSTSAARYTKQLSKIRRNEIEVALDDSLTRGERVLRVKEINAERNELVSEFNSEFVDVMRNK